MLYNKLFDYQKEIVDKFKERNNFGLFLDMGLGKTPISLSFCEVNNVEKIIIITINSKATEIIEEKGSWINWLSQIEPSFNYFNKQQLKKAKFGERDAIVINYEGLMERNTAHSKSSIILKDYINEFIKSCKNKKVALIIDESHKIKTSTSLQTKTIFKIKDLLNIRAEKLYTYLLTGTPFTCSYLDLLSQLQLLGCKMPKYEFIERYCIKGSIMGLYEWQQPIIGYKNIEELYRLVHKYAITIKSEEVLNLPPQLFTYFRLDESRDFKLFTREKLKGSIINDECKKRSLNEEYEGNKQVLNPFYRNLEYPENEDSLLDTATMWLRSREISIGFLGNRDNFRWYNKKRLNKLEDFLKNNIDNYVIFYNFTAELVELYSICEKLKYNIDVYCGEIKSLYFYENYEKMNNENKIKNKGNVIISNYASGSTGKNWQAYNKCIMFSIPLFKDYNQSLKRIHRIGQKEPTFYYVFYENNWLDKGMLESLKNKENYNSKMFEKDLNRNN